MRWPVAALATIVIAGTLANAGLGTLLRGPSVFADELIYMDATRSVAEGHRPMERDRTYGRGPLYPFVAAPVIALAPSELDAYRALRVFNALLFALAAVPAFLLARRLLDRSWSVAVAALTVAVPSAVYTGMVLTESAAYLTGTLALFALVAALERPTARRQLAALGAVGLATLARPQLVALVVALPVGLVFRWIASPQQGRSRAELFRTLRPTGAALAAVALLAAAAFGSGRVSLRDYEDVFTSYDVVEVVRWSWYTVGNLALYLALVPAVVAPAALLALWRRGRAGLVPAVSFVGIFVPVNVVTILLVAAFSSASFGGERLHDRYLFYVIPLWLVLVAWWLHARIRPPMLMIAVGGVLTALVVGTLPERLLARDTNLQFDAVATAMWSRIRELDPSRPNVLRLVLVASALCAAGLAVLPIGRRVSIVAVLLAVFATNAVLVWQSRAHDADLHVFADDRAGTWSWVDAAVPADATVTDVFVESSRCTSVNTGAFRWTEFFNARIAPVIRLGVPVGITTDGRSARLGADGIVRTLAGAPVRARYAVTPPGLALQGRSIARGTLSNLRLWALDGRIRVLNARSNVEAVGVACPAQA